MRNYAIVIGLFLAFCVVGYYGSGLSKAAAAADARLAQPAPQNAEQWLASQGVK